MNIENTRISLSLQLQERTFIGTSTERVYAAAVRHVYHNAVFDTDGSSFGGFTFHEAIRFDHVDNMDTFFITQLQANDDRDLLIKMILMISFILFHILVYSMLGSELMSAVSVFLFAQVVE